MMALSIYSVLSDWSIRNISSRSVLPNLISQDDIVALLPLVRRISCARDQSRLDGGFITH